MISVLNSTALCGIDGYIVDVEADISNGMPGFDIVGLPDAAVKESKERIRAAVKNSGLVFPAKHITVNLAPADIKKEGAHFDLPIALGILASSEQLDKKHLSDAVFIGELSLNGDLRRVSGVLPMVISAYQKGIRRVFLPKDNAKEAAVVSGMEVFGAECLKDILEHFLERKSIEPTVVDVRSMLGSSERSKYDFADVKGQVYVKRALEIAAAGGHNILMIGPPGSGKTMIAQRIPSILPELTFEESLEVTKIHSIAGTLTDSSPLVAERPFRHPHHTISSVGLSGGGTNPKPGEISLSHNGVLFMDELPEFRRDALEAMRQPLEDGEITISRAGGSATYPCSVMLVASMNPCPCGYYGDKNKECNCSQTQILKYMRKISGPLLDRIDMHIEVPSVDFEELEAKTRGESSASIKKRVDEARRIQTERYSGSSVYSNSRLTPELMQKYCALGQEAGALLKQAFESLGLSARAHNRILKVARTIADLSGSENIEMEHIAEAIQYRALDKKFFN
ncbi:MAG: YifB family Mg chelatase-like AAA ATPase [Clostridia bacterium]|nr:ATP-binding protein [Oscillospiraceae bacterium]MBQ7960568.1 YifB family Mg chelatase-like AAA ATPase [Clostridia bacterium]